MSKKTFIIIAVLAILVIGGVTGYFVLNSRSSQGTDKQRSLSQKSGSQKEEIKVDTLYEDTSGFSFKYPKDIKVKDVTPEGDEYYTQLDLTKGNEKITITIKDTLVKTTDDWIKSDSAYKGASLVGATSLAGISAKQYSKNETLLMVAVDQGIVYLIEGPKDGGFWEDVQGALISTFKFAGTTTSGGSSSGGSDVIYEEEEIVE